MDTINFETKVQPSVSLQQAELRNVQQGKALEKGHSLRTKDELSKAPKKQKSEKNQNVQPKLPTPDESIKKAEQELGTNEAGSVIAVMGEILALQAKSNSLFWETLWNEGGQSMRAAVDLAPLIGQAVQSSFNEQASISRSEATSALWQGVTSIGAGAFAIGGGLFSAGKEMYGNSTTTDSEIITKGTPVDEDDDEECENTTQQVGRDMSPADDANGASESLKNNGNAAVGGGKSTSSWLVKAFERSYQAVVVAQMFNSGINSFIEFKYKNQIADHQEKAGAYDAISKMMEQYAQYYNQNFSRQEELRQGSQQNIDFSMQILKSISDTVTSTTQSMFRG